MHFRIRKNVIQLIRTNYDEAKKKGNATIIGSVGLFTPELSQELQNKMTDTEIMAFQSWLKTQHRMIMLREEMAALNLAETIELAEKWFSRADNNAATELLAHEIVLRWQSLRKVFAKKGLLE